MSILKIRPKAAPAAAPVANLMGFVLSHNLTLCPVESIIIGAYPIESIRRVLLYSFSSIYILMSIEARTPKGTPINVPRHLAQTGV